MDLIKELGLEDFSEEEKNEILVQFTDSLLKRLMARVYANLNAADQKEFRRLSDSKDQAGVEKFFSEKVPGLDRIRDEELKNLTEEAREFMKTAK